MNYCDCTDDCPGDDFPDESPIDDGPVYGGEGPVR